MATTVLPVAGSSRHLGGAVEDRSVGDGALGWVKEGPPRLEVSGEQSDEFGVVGRYSEVRLGTRLPEGCVDVIGVDFPTAEVVVVGQFRPDFRRSSLPSARSSAASP